VFVIGVLFSVMAVGSGSFQHDEDQG